MTSKNWNKVSAKFPRHTFTLPVPSPPPPPQLAPSLSHSMCSDSLSTELTSPVPGTAQHPGNPMAAGCVLWEAQGVHIPSSHKVFIISV